MERISYTYQMNPFSSRLTNHYLENKSLCVFDIETLGLNPSTQELVLAGILSVDKDGICTVTQLFIDSLDQEKDLLLAIKDELNKYDILLTYNGKHFDLPFLLSRAKKHELSNYYITGYNLDLYLFLNGHSQLRKALKSLSQKSVEEYMGLSDIRTDTISGKESVDLYYKFMECSQPYLRKQLKEKILLHNHDDILQLYKLMPALHQTDIHKAFNHLGVPIQGKNAWPNMVFSKTKISGGSLIISGQYKGPEFMYIAYNSPERPFSCTFGYDNSFDFQIELKKQNKSFYINLWDFFNENDDEAISQIKTMPGYVNGFLILFDDGQLNYLEVNTFIKIFLDKFINETVFTPM